MLAVEEVTSLQLIDAGIKSLFDIQHLGQCIHLSDLNLHCNRLKRIENLASLTALQSLNLSANSITRIEGLESLHHLQELNLASNHVFTRFTIL
jgi:Leucine-rich repeat (LRR) protein